MPLILPIIGEKRGNRNKKSMFNEFSKFRRRLLSQQESESLLDGDSLPAVLIFGRKSKYEIIKNKAITGLSPPGRMCTERWISQRIHLSHGVNPLVVVVHVVHHVHLYRVCLISGIERKLSIS